MEYKDKEGRYQIQFDSWPYEVLMCLAKHTHDSVSGVMLRFCSNWNYLILTNAVGPSSQFYLRH